MKTQNQNEAGFIQRNISKFIVLIFILQPLMDMLSFFVEKIGTGYSITLLLRFGVLALTALVGFIASKRKKAYILFALAALFVLAGHVVACMKQEYLQPVDADTMAKWDTLISVRDDVNGVLEAARAEKKIGKSLDAQVVLHANDDAAKAAVSAIETLTLNDMFIVSKCLIDADDEGDVTVGNGTRNTGLTIAVSEAKGEKCPRCWAHTEEADPETGLCPRCAKVVAELT